MADLNKVVPKDNREVLCDSNNCFINIKSTEYHRDWPLISKTYGNFMPFDVNDIKIWFEGILNGSTLINKIDGAYVDHNTKYQCDLCCGDINEDYYYCQECKFDICIMCYNNKKGMGLESKAVQTCVKKHQYIMVKRTISEPNICGVCSFMNNYHIKPINTQYLYTNQTASMCMPCSMTPHGQTIIKTYGLELQNNKLPCYLEFGSVFDWIPMITNIDHDINDVLLMNYNVNSPYYTRFAVYSNNEFSVLPCSMTLEDITDIANRYASIRYLVKS